MRKYLFYFILFMVFSSYAQNSVKKQYSYTIGKPYKIFNATNRLYLEKGNEILSVKYKNNIVAIQKYDSERLELISIHEYNDFNKKVIIEELVKAKDKYYMFYSLWSDNKANVYGELYCREIDFDKGEFVNKGFKVLNLKDKLRYDYTTKYINSGNERDRMHLTFSKENRKKITFLKSKDESKLAILYSVIPKIKSDIINHDRIGLYVCDNKMNKLWSKQYIMPHSERKMDVLSYTLLSNGNVIFLVRVFHDNSNKDFKNNTINFHLEIIEISEKVNQANNFKINFGNHYLSSALIFEDDVDSSINCIGFYNGSVSNSDTWSKRNNNFKTIPGNADGIFYFKKDLNTSNIIFDKKHEIPIEVIVKYLGKGGKKRMEVKDKEGRAEFVDLKLRTIIFLENGEILLLGEQLYIDISTFYEFGFSQSSKPYVKDLFIAKINSKGDVLWMDRLAKRQKGDFLDKSFNYFKMKDKHYVVFLDHIKNLDLEEEDVPERFDDGGGKKGHLMIYEIDDKTGKVNKDAIFDLKKIDDEMSGHLFNINRVVRVSDDTFVLELYKREQEEVLIKVKRN